MKNKFLAIVPAIFLLFSCEISFFNNKTVNPDNETDYEDIEPGPLKDHATSMTLDPHAPFYLKVNETKEIKASFDQTPTDANEKIMNWTTSNSKVQIETDPTNPMKAIITGREEGQCQVTCENVYNTSLVKSVQVKVVDFDSDNSYLWQYQSSDRAQFGYNSSTAKQGVQSGVAQLGEKSWAFERSNLTSLQSLYSAVGFGKGDAPETLVTLRSSNKRTVNKIIIETSSANSLTNCTVKVGDDVVINKKSPATENDVVGTLSTEDNLNLTGDISIIFETPEFDKDAYEADPIYYKSPGAVYLKSIYIIYEPEEEPDYLTESTINFVDVFQNKTENAEFWQGITTSAKEKTYAKDGISYYFQKIKAPSDAQYFNTNGEIVIKAPEGETFSKVEFKTIKISNSNNTYTGYGSLVNGEPYTYQYGSSIDNVLNFRIYDKNVNTILLKNSGTANVGLVSLTVKTVSGEHAEIENVAFESGSAPIKLTYSVGENFDPTGLGNAIATFTNSEIEPIVIPLECFKFYDGTSYDNNPTLAEEKLSVDSTYVYAVYKTFIIKVEGISVVDIPISLTLVKNTSEISATEKYYLVCVEKKKMLKGSAGGDMSTAAGIADLSEVSFSDLITIPGLYAFDYFTITSSNGGYSLKSTTDKMLGMTDKGNISTAANPSNKVFNISIDDQTGIATFEITAESETPVTKYLVFGNSTISLVESGANISIYKAQ